jgi:hypothetical protein
MSRYQYFCPFVVICCLIASPMFAQVASENLDQSTLKGKNFNNITLEVSLKPFKKNDKAYIQSVAKEIFTQWFSLLRHTDTVSVMLWTADGSEVLDYKGDMSQRLEWARYIGNPNTKHEVGSGPAELSLHERAFLYMDNPPEFTYGDLKYIISILKETGKQITGKPIRIGATFDPGPEFAKSEFKYKKHPEILGGNVMGHKTFVSCYSVLNADKEKYAGYPNGIPANTPFGTFFGKQSQQFLSDLGYDYIWFSNGFGFGVEGWSSTGAIFTGKVFQQEKLGDATAKIAEFWRLFRKECPEFQVQTRGTNLSAGADLARDGVDLRAIYRGNLNILPPPNSPWAALDGDFGLELAGHLSRIAELPDNRFLFRYYTHDPWWVNSPWLDRYGREPHDIYLPMSISRIDRTGTVGVPTHLNFLTIDNSFGEMPTQVPDEVTPHILKARYDLPTAAGPLVWIYPFEEYHDWAHQYKDRLPEVYYGDWFIRQAINNGLPLNTVVSTTSFQSVIHKSRGYFKESVMISIAPDAGSALEKSLIEFVSNGGKLIIFGPVDHSGPAFLEMLNLQNVSPIEGELMISKNFSIDKLIKAYPDVINHRALFSGGGVRTKVKDKNDAATRVLASVRQSVEERDIAWSRAKKEWNGGRVVYVRGTNSSNFDGGRLLTPDDPQKYFIGQLHLRYALNEFGISCGIEKESPAIRSPVITISRSNNAFIFSGYSPNTTVRHEFKFPQGAPLLLGFDTELSNGSSTYGMPAAWSRESRIFVDQTSGTISYSELHSGEKGIKKRFQVTGLQNATVRIYPEDNVTAETLKVYVNSRYPWRTGQVTVKAGDPKLGKHFAVENVTGELVVAW